MFPFASSMLAALALSAAQDQPAVEQPIQYDNFQFEVVYRDAVGNVTAVSYLPITDKVGKSLYEQGVAKPVRKDRPAAQEIAVPVSDPQVDGLEAGIRQNTPLQMVARLRSMGFGMNQRPYDRSYGMYSGWGSTGSAGLEYLRLSAERQSVLDAAIIMAEQEQQRIRTEQLVRDTQSKKSAGVENVAREAAPTPATEPTPRLAEPEKLNEQQLPPKASTAIEFGEAVAAIQEASPVRTMLARRVSQMGMMKAHRPVHATAAAKRVTQRFRQSLSLPAADDVSKAAPAEPVSLVQQEPAEVPAALARPAAPDARRTPSLAEIMADYGY